MEIPHSQLSKEVLDAVIEEFITREGTDYGDRVISLDDKVEQVRVQLDRGDVFLSFDPLSQSCSFSRVNSVRPCKVLTRKRANRTLRDSCHKARVVNWKKFGG